jgi:hypothetical protein
MKHDFSSQTICRRVQRLTDLELARVRYCYQIGSTFVAVALLEDAVITSMLVCDRVKVSTALGDDAPKWEYFLKKHKHLQDSTLGSLISILSRHSLAEADLNYLKWLKSKRDFFIHRHFQAGPWPGDFTRGSDRSCLPNSRRSRVGISAGRTSDDEHIGPCPADEATSYPGQWQPSLQP